MGLLNKVLSWKADPREEVAKIFPLASCEPEDCDGCNSKFPSTVQVEMEGSLWNNTPKWDLHVLASTGKTDWQHDPADEKHSMMKALAKGDKMTESEKLAGGNIKMQASSMSLPHEHYEVDDQRKAPGSMLLLPYFLSIEGTTPETCSSDLHEVIKLWTDAEKRKSLADYKLLSGSKVHASQNMGYILLCSHRTRDKRCGITAPIMKKEFEMVLREHDLYRDASDDRPGGVQLHFISHVGGHKFSANVIIYLRTGEVIWMARTRPEHCRRIVETTMLQGQVFPHLLRQAFKTDGVDW